MWVFVRLQSVQKELEQYDLQYQRFFRFRSADLMSENSHRSQITDESNISTSRILSSSEVHSSSKVLPAQKRRSSDSVPMPLLINSNAPVKKRHIAPLHDSSLGRTGSFCWMPFFVVTHATQMRTFRHVILRNLCRVEVREYSLDV
jgi:hypothetical protein